MKYFLEWGTETEDYLLGIGEKRSGEQRLTFLHVSVDTNSHFQ